MSTRNRERDTGTSRPSDFFRWLLKIIAGYLVTSQGALLVGILITWVGLVNFSLPNPGWPGVLVSDVISLVQSNSIFLLLPIIIIAVTYRLPKTMVFLSSVALATLHLTPLRDADKVSANIGLLTAGAISVFVLGSIFLVRRLRKSFHPNPEPGWHPNPEPFPRD